MRIAKTLLLASAMLALPSLTGCGGGGTKEDAAPDTDAVETSDFSGEDAIDEDATAEEEAPAEDAAEEDVAVEDAAVEDAGAEDVRSEDARSEDVAAEDARSEDIRAEDPAAEDIRPEDAAAEDIRPEDAAAEDIRPEDAAAEDAPAEDARLDEVTEEEPASPPAVASVDYPVIAHGANLAVTGTGFTGATDVSIGGQAQVFTVDTPTQITVLGVADATPTGARDVVVTTPAGSNPGFSVTVIHLVVSELDCDTPSTDVLEFVEISTGVAGVSLAGYVLVFWNGASDDSYASYNLGGSSAVTNGSGLLLVGNSGVSPSPDITFTNNLLQNGEDAVSIHQGTTASFPTGSSVTSSGLIDALVYDTGQADDADLLSILLGSGPEAVQVNEAANAAGTTDSIQRCPTQAARLDGRVWAVRHPVSPKALNTCP